jgi:hypothetical protein
MADILVDSNVLLDVLTFDPVWSNWSIQSLENLAEHHILVINPVIYAEVSIGFERVEDLDSALPENLLERRPIPFAAAFMAGKCYVKYRKQGGTRNSTLPDFFIGAHAAVEGMTLLTRDASRYRTYFPRVKLICPP